MPTPHYGLPRYRAIAEELRERIESGVIPPGALLPTESTLTTEYRASRGTVRQAIAALRDDGLVATEHGRGTYVQVSPLKACRLLESDSATRKREVAASAELAKLFGIEVGAPLLEQESIQRSDGAVETVTKIYKLPKTTR
ncbi:GntR family transcriptional regulator [Micromonospora sp. NPDC049175]|uniref:GntR family transcriptional regulator n=1 Tax=Micromonospora sp. NPDC049175 TaxID=3364266 RepID=UPI0037100854